MKRKSSANFIVCVIAIALVGWLVYERTVEHSSNGSDGGLHMITYVYDGDTVKLDNGERVRLIGIDSPEAHVNAKLARDVGRRRMDGDTQLRMGMRASEFAHSFLDGKQVRVEYDVEKRDQYGRLLAYLYLSDGTFVNEKIIREGYAYPLTIPPNVRHAAEFADWFREARHNRRGLWSRER